ncbi:unnamed protein product [Litomosoides sigmodontis]|uniref:ZP domain-containing protein n=1 Tax=Litomosoides sigmodontis TaxID=42156 RepID=A0A3P6U2H1_LITSI|nr:unnamed protein product [Litomosoides sigmodontis]
MLSNERKKCTAVNFVIDIQNDPMCLLIDQSREANESEMPIQESVIYSAASFFINKRLSSQCSDSTAWAFERFPNKDLIEGSKSSVVFLRCGQTKIKRCEAAIASLEAFGIVERKQCRAALYNKKVAQCRYLNVSIQSVHNTKKFFEHSEDVDLYENNCFPEHLTMNVAQCQFIRMQSSGFTDFFDERIADVICHIHSDLEVPPVDQHLSFRFLIEDENVTKQIARNIQIASQLRNYVTQPRYTMEVMDINKNPVEVVQIGDEGYLLLTLHDKPIKFSIIDLSARDTRSGRAFKIIDSNGCAVPNGMVKSIHRIDKNHLQLAIVFNGFSDEANIIYEAYAISCDEFCDSNSCTQVNSVNQKNKNKNAVQKRQPMMASFESRLFQLSGDLYAVKSSNRLKFKRKLWKNEGENNALQTESVLMFYEEPPTDVSGGHCIRRKRHSEIVELDQNIGNKQQTVGRLPEN